MVLLGRVVRWGPGAVAGAGRAFRISGGQVTGQAATPEGSPVQAVGGAPERPERLGLVDGGQPLAPHVADERRRSAGR